MRRYTVKQKLKSAAAFLIILIFLPYVVSVFVNGVDVTGNNSGSPFYVRVRVPDNEEADGVGEVEWTEYLAGILAEEMPKDSEEEALKAQAVLIRTQIYRELEESEDKVLEENYLPAEELRKRWGAEEFDTAYKKYVRAIEETDDTVLLYGDTYAWTPFHQSSAGMTRSAAEAMGTDQYPYVAVRECPFDKKAEDEIQVFTFTCSEIQKLCRDFLVAVADGDRAAMGYSFEDFEITKYDSAGYVSEMRIGETVCTGDQFRDALSLPSGAFSFSEAETADSGDENAVKITTTGKGHGLGMSLWTARQMAAEGKTYEEILSFFFEGTELRKDIQETELF